MTITIPSRYLHRTAVYSSETAKTLAEAVSEAVRRGISFGEGDLRGANLDGLDLRRVDLQNAVLCGASLRHACLHAATLSYTDLAAADLTGADLTEADLHYTEFAGARLNGADLTGADFTTATWRGATLTGATLGEDIPVVPHLKEAILRAITEEGGELDMGAWHTCSTTHCLAGWACILAGKRGRELERDMSTNNAAVAIFAHSVGSVPDFFCHKDEAMAYLRSEGDA